MTLRDSEPAGSRPDRVRCAERHGNGPAAPNGLGVALGGGFARAFAHLGVLQVLEEQGIPVSCIAGTSAGSILGTAYASGIPLARIAQVCRSIRFRDFGRWRISRLGLATNDRLGELVHRWFQATTFEELLIPSAVVSTDLGTGEAFVFTRGEVAEAIRASCAFPGLFEPVHLDGRCLADGGLVAPVPTLAARALGARCVLGVSVGFNHWSGAAPSNLFQVVCRAVSIAQKHQTASWNSSSDFLLEPDVRGIDWGDFHRADDAIAAGAAATRAALPRLRQLLGQTEDLQAEPDRRADTDGQGAQGAALP